MGYSDTKTLRQLAAPSWCRPRITAPAVQPRYHAAMPHWMNAPMPILH